MSASQRRERVRRTLTFWLRPAFALRVVGRFQSIAGFDRSMALASSALTALVPFAVLMATILARADQQDLAGRIVSRYNLSGGGAEAVTQLFSYAKGPDTTLSLLGSVFLIISTLSFTRAAQRLFEQTWELPPLSVRNTVNGLRWLLLLSLYTVVTGWLQAALGGARFGLWAVLCQLPLTAAFLVFGGRLLSAKRLDWRELVPFGVLAAVLSAVYTFGTTVYLPRLFSSYASRYGSLGAVFAMITALFGAMLTLVGSAAVGREVADELERIREGRRPPDDEVRREWDKVRAQMRERWLTARAELGRRRESGGSRHRH